MAAMRGSAIMCSRHTSGACFATDSWWTGRSSTNTVALGCISPISSTTGRPLPPWLQSTRWRMSNRSSWAMRLARYWSPILVRMTMSAFAPIVRSASSAPATSCCRCISRSKKLSSNSQARSRVTSAPVSSRSAPAKLGTSSEKLKPCASATHSAKCGAKWSSTSSQSEIRSGRLIAPAPPAPQPAAPAKRRDRPRRRPGRAHGLRGSAALRRGSRDPPAARASRPGSARSAPPAAARASSLSVQPSAPRASASSSFV